MLKMGDIIYAEIIEQCQLLVTVKVKDDATNEDIEKAINVAYLDDDCEILEQRLHEITKESKAKLFEKTYDAYLLAQSVTRVYGVESPPGQSAMKKLRAEVKACSDKDLLEEYLDYQDRENKRIESIWGEW